MTICYLLVALGKVADIYFVVYGKGKTLQAARARLIPAAKFDLQQFAELSNKELLDYVRNVNSAADANEVVSDSVIRASRLRIELDRLNEGLRAFPAQKAAADQALDPARPHLRTTDRELVAMLAEFERILGAENMEMRNDSVRGIAAGQKREHESMQLAAWIGMIKESREKIHALTGDH